MFSRMPSPRAGRSAASHLLLFASLFHPGRGVAVPCDAAGVVDLDALPRCMLNAYRGARAMIGREYACPVVRPQP